ncbi:MAG: hypothetical protein LGB62_04425 [Sulfurovum sp.]|nr:hypothetical protein [Sulfurovum sp.]
MQYFTITLVLSVQLFANNLYWYNDNQKIQIYNLGYDEKYHAFFYSNSKKRKAKKMVLTNNIILAFKKKVGTDTLNMILDKYHLQLIQTMAIGNGFYVLRCLDNNPLDVANQIYENENSIKSSYPDWMYSK